MKQFWSELRTYIGCELVMFGLNVWAPEDRPRDLVQAFHDFLKIQVERHSHELPPNR